MSEELILGGEIPYNTTINTRIINKNDTTENWESASFTPYKGELIVYNDDIQKIKIGNGEDSINELSFIGSDYVVEAGIEEAPIVLDTDNSITWHWRRWASGIVEIWGRSDTYSETLYAQGNGYISDRRFFRFPLGLIKSGTTPVVNITLQQVNYGQPWVSIADCGPAGCAAGLCCFITGPRTARYHIRAIGEWGGIRAKVVSYTDGEYTTTDEVITLKTNKVSRNLFPISSITTDKQFNGHYAAYNLQDEKIFELFNSLKGYTFTYTSEVDNTIFPYKGFTFYTADGYSISNGYIGRTSSWTFTIPSDADDVTGTIEFLVRSNSADTQGERATLSNIQFEFGSTAHDYEPWTGVTKLDDTFTTDGKQVYYSSDPDVGYCFFTFI